jgi:hypothetical protein
MKTVKIFATCCMIISAILIVCAFISEYKYKELLFTMSCTTAVLGTILHIYKSKYVIK